ncbi:unnamed protein product [Spirodela intermedia]|uniref:Large ribosomal subunit protein uL15/eL18 domain-containing protein n=1 Tax=Spirodela intermedia TaxID=51605 RepID=A0A7I8JFP3_SPIIN|nr:unnamed protein product [Spirodela intermedia]CAA6668976.1 unnamed protein product [Spirodela intermedia]
MWRQQLRLLLANVPGQGRPSLPSLGAPLAPCSAASFSTCSSPWRRLLPGTQLSVALLPRWMSSTALLRLNDLQDSPGRKHKKKHRWTGPQRAEGPGTMKFGFEGGQTPLRRRLPKRGFKNPFSLTFQPVGLGKIAKLINAGKIDSGELITMKTLKDTGAIGKQIEDGVRLMGRGAEHIQWPIHLEVSRVTVRAKAAVEAAGGSVRKVYYNKLGLRALLKPEWFEKKGRLLPKAARPPPKQQDKVDSIGRLPAPTKPIPFPARRKRSSCGPASILILLKNKRS